MISIGTLEKHVETFAKKLRKQGHEAEVLTHRSGTITGCDTERVSNVLLKVGTRRIKFMANGYGSLELRDDIGGISTTWTEMKQEAIKRLNLGAH